MYYLTIENRSQIGNESILLMILMSFKECRNNGKFLGAKSKKKHFAEALGHKELKVSNGWSEKLKKKCMQLCFIKPATKVLVTMCVTPGKNN